MAKKMILIYAIATLTALNADPLETSPGCIRPIKPVKFTNNNQVEQFNAESQRYKTCIDTFIAQHKENIQRSTDAINNTIKEWNSFVTTTNTKKDSPFPIQGKTGISEGGSHNVGYRDPTQFTTGFSF
jgi:hypothetical protein